MKLLIDVFWVLFIGACILWPSFFLLYMDWLICLSLQRTGFRCEHDHWPFQRAPKK